MAKRSTGIFARKPRDLYPTIDPKAIAPLKAHLGGVVLYSEPCAGDGSLIRLLDGVAECVWASDIKPLKRGIYKRDALKMRLGAAQMFITNPPWSRALLHALIIHLSNQGPTWLLFDADWAHTKQAQPFMSRCRKIVSVGRLNWQPGTKMSGKDNVAWYLFDKPIPGSTPEFFPASWKPPENAGAARRCYDCRVMIDRFGKWSLEPRNGIMTPVHRHCDNPNSYYPLGQEELPPAPLLDLMCIPIEEAA